MRGFQKSAKEHRKSTLRALQMNEPLLSVLLAALIKNNQKEVSIV